MASHAHSVWLRTLGLLALWLAAAVLLGMLVGHPWPAVAIAALAVVAWQCWRLQQVLARLRARQWPEPAGGDGAWRELERLLHRSHLETRGRNRRLVEMLRAYQAAAAALPDAIVVVERNTQRLQWFNAAGESLLGLRYPDDIDAPLVERLQPLPIAHWLAAGRNAEPLEAASPWNPAATLSLRLIPYSENLWLLVARDISRILQLEQVRRDFVANVSHELRTPLTVVHGYLDMFDDVFEADQGREWAPMVAEMRKQSQRMAQLVEDLLTLSRLESQDRLADEENVSMESIMHTLDREAHALSKGQHRIRVDDQAGVDLWGLGKELHSAFSNLVANAVRYTPADGRVTIRLRREPDSAGGVVLEVIDSGQGISPAHLPRITERFYRVSTSRSRHSGGTGLGLSIVKHVLNLHQARLTIDSEVGRGSTFACHFGAERVRAREVA